MLDAIAGACREATAMARELSTMAAQADSPGVAGRGAPPAATPDRRRCRRTLEPLAVNSLFAHACPAPSRCRMTPHLSTLSRDTPAVQRVVHAPIGLAYRRTYPFRPDAEKEP